MVPGGHISQVATNEYPKVEQNSPMQLPFVLVAPLEHCWLHVGVHAHVESPESLKNARSCCTVKVFEHILQAVAPVEVMQVPGWHWMHEVMLALIAL